MKNTENRKKILSRRSFVQSTSVAAAVPFIGSGAQGKSAPVPGVKEKWYKSAWRRAVIDMHIPDWDDRFLSKFDPENYAEMIRKAKAQSIVCYAHSHVGLFNYPTKVGQQHRSLKGRNMLGEMIDACHKRDINVVIYTSLIHDYWAYVTHPEWGMYHPDGSRFGHTGRYRLVCPNSPYREYVRAWVEEICRNFEFEGIRFDMTFWVNVCYCEHCRKRFADEVGGEMPVTVDWFDERWVALQRKREEWMADFAEVATDTVRRMKPAASVEHQSSTYPLPWTFGVAGPLVRNNTFLQGDFYGDQLQGSFVRKMLSELSPDTPFGYETSVCVNLRDHTAIKSEALLEAKASAAVADSAAFIFIDGIDPAGTLNPKVYERMGNIFGRLMPYYGHLGGERIQDIAIYYSLESKFSFTDNKRSVRDSSRKDDHTESSMKASRWLIQNHLPFGVITKKSLLNLSRHRVLILSNVNMMDEEEASAIRAWVKGGGSLYASGATSLVDTKGDRKRDFMLADVFGASIKKADWEPKPHYIAPTESGTQYFSAFDASHPAFAPGFGMEAAAHPGTEILATTTDIWQSDDREKFSSIHSNPPWQPTDRPEIIFNRFGRGKVIYCSTPLENLDTLNETFIGLIRLLNADFTFDAEAPPVVEMTMFRQKENNRYIFCLLDFQDTLPNIPVDGIKIRLRLPGENVRKIICLPGGEPVDFMVYKDTLILTAPRLETLVMLSVEMS